MLNRRHIREKVMKALYAFFQSDGKIAASGEKELFHSIDKVYEVYLYYLTILPELKDFAHNLNEERKLKRLPTDEDLNPKLNFVNNAVIQKIEENQELFRNAEKLKINWNSEQDLIKKLYYQIMENASFRVYLEKEVSFKEDKEILFEMYENIIFPSDSIRHVFEERSIYWLDDIEVMQAGVLKTLKSIKETNPGEPSFKLQPLHKEAEEDREFASKLFRQTILNSAEYEIEISKRAQNWEIERVAKMDVILMKMAICELIAFPSIPVKVTLDEYIELSKDYSSPQSKTFINGILDKLVIDYKRENKIQKAGRGLVE
jgi:N utilization substance protein B